MRDIVRVNDFLFEAKKNNDKIANDALSYLMAELRNKRIQLGRMMTADEMICVAKKVAKELREDIDVAAGAGRFDLVEEYKAKLVVIDDFIPIDMSVEDVEKIVRDNINGSMNKGQAMKIIMPILRGKADGKVISSVVDKVLAEN